MKAREEAARWQQMAKRMDIIEREMTKAEFARMNAGLVEQSEGGSGSALEIEHEAAIQAETGRGHRGDNGRGANSMGTVHHMGTN